jgi:hypothetical protein
MLRNHEMSLRDALKNKVSVSGDSSMISNRCIRRPSDTERSETLVPWECWNVSVESVMSISSPVADGKVPTVRKESLCGCALVCSVPVPLLSADPGRARSVGDRVPVFSALRILLRMLYKLLAASARKTARKLDKMLDVWSVTSSWRPVSVSTIAFIDNHNSE